jgi:hypothetical protein
VTCVGSSASPSAPSTTGEVSTGGLEVNEAKRREELESENGKLKRLLAEKLLEVEAMKDVLSIKW